MKKGISLIVLAISISVILILISTVTISGISSANTAKKQTFAKEVILLQSAIDTYRQNNNFENPISDYVIVDMSGMSDDVKNEQFSGETIDNNTLTLQIIDYDKIGVTSLKYGYKKDGDNDIYAYSTKTSKVYYVKGIKVSNKTYFTLTDELKKLTLFNVSDNLETNNGIIFEPSTTEFTRDFVSVLVKVPQNYINVSVKVLDNNYEISKNEASYNEYNVNYENIDNPNYTILVTFQKDENSQAITANFNVDNVDNVAPELTVDAQNQKLVEDTDKSNIYAYLNITKKYDNLSGIKVVKYENEKIMGTTNIENYFKSSGNIVRNDTIPIAKNVKWITTYIEDNAGNWYSEWIEVDDNIYSKLLQGVSVASVNEPLLSSNMIPVIINEETGDITTTTKDDKNWYDYEKKKWANVAVYDGNNIVGFYVWIPRYEYRILTPHVTDASTISVKFINSKSTTVTQGYNIPKCFSFNDVELTGIWVAKFEASGSTDNIYILPGKTPMKNINISDAFTACLNMKNLNYYNEAGTDIHLIKNAEWGAVAYLSNSIYGINQKISANETSYTGATEDNKIPVTSILQTTTGNVTGIYDMSGGLDEFVAAYLNNSNNALSANGNSLLLASSKYIDEYKVAVSDTSESNYEQNSDKISDAIYETSLNGINYSSWYGENSIMAYNNLPFFIRGGNYDSASNPGIFNFSATSGLAGSDIGFRPVIIVSAGLQ